MSWAWGNMPINPGTWRAEAGESQVQGLLGQLGPFQEKKLKKGLGCSSVTECLPSICKDLGSIPNNTHRHTTPHTPPHTDTPHHITPPTPRKHTDTTLTPSPGY